MESVEASGATGFCWCFSASEWRTSAATFDRLFSHAECVNIDLARLECRAELSVICDEKCSLSLTQPAEEISKNPSHPTPCRRPMQYKELSCVESAARRRVVEWGGRGAKNYGTGKLTDLCSASQPCRVAGFRCPSPSPLPPPASVNRRQNFPHLRMLEHVIPQPVILLGARLGKGIVTK
jgi:hypothetical protein